MYMYMNLYIHIYVYIHTYMPKVKCIKNSVILW